MKIRRWISRSPATTIGGTLALILSAAGCPVMYSPAPGEGSQVLHAYPAPQRPDSALATLDLGRVNSVRIDSLAIDRDKHGIVKLLPGVHCIHMSDRGYGLLFAAWLPVWFWPFNDVLTGRFALEAGHVYRLEEDTDEEPLGWDKSLYIRDVTNDRILGPPTPPCS